MRSFTPPPTKKPPPSPGEAFETISHPLAAAFIAAGQLVYSHSKLNDNGTLAVFVFRDKWHIGEELQRRYLSGAFPLVHAKVLAEAHKFLAEESNRVLKEAGRASNKA